MKKLLLTFMLSSCLFVLGMDTQTEPQTEPRTEPRTEPQTVVSTPTDPSTKSFDSINTDGSTKKLSHVSTIAELVSFINNLKQEKVTKNGIICRNYRLEDWADEIIRYIERAIASEGITIKNNNNKLSINPKMSEKRISSMNKCIKACKEKTNEYIDYINSDFYYPITKDNLQLLAKEYEETPNFFNYYIVNGKKKDYYDDFSSVISDLPIKDLSCNQNQLTTENITELNTMYEGSSIIFSNFPVKSFKSNKRNDSTHNYYVKKFLKNKSCSDNCSMVTNNSEPKNFSDLDSDCFNSDYSNFDYSIPDFE